MKIFLSGIATMLLVFGVGSAQAAPSPDNPNVVVYYATGPHTIPIENQITLEGADLVMKHGNSGNFNQWFWNDEVEYHSVWNVTKNGKCKGGVLIEDPHPEWGDYLVPGADYCVITN